MEDTQPIVALDLDPPTGQTDPVASMEVVRNKAERMICMTDLSWHLFHLTPQKDLDKSSGWPPRKHHTGVGGFILDHRSATLTLTHHTLTNQ